MNEQLNTIVLKRPVSDMVCGDEKLLSKHIGKLLSVLLTPNSSYTHVSQVPDYASCRIHTCINHILDSVRGQVISKCELMSETV